jgi:holo-[acyl-carrier protein] synthase
MKLSTGIDLIEISRLEEVITRHGNHFLERVYTPAELKHCKGRMESLAGRFAAKEAASKALRCGIGDIGWKEIEVLGDEQNAPVLTLHGVALQKAKELGLSIWSVSISHSMKHVVASVTMIGD